MRRKKSPLLLCVVALGIWCLGACSSEMEIDTFHLMRAVRSADVAEHYAEQAELDVEEIERHNKELETILEELERRKESIESQLVQCKAKVKVYGIKVDEVSTNP